MTDNPKCQAAHPHGSASSLKSSPLISLPKDHCLRLQLPVVRAGVFINQQVRGEINHLIPREDATENNFEGIGEI